MATQNEIDEIKSNRRLCSFDSIGFENIRFDSIEQVIKNLFGLKKSDNTEYKSGYFNYGRCGFKKSKEEAIWFPKLTNDNDADVKNIWSCDLFIEILKSKEADNEPSLETHIYIFAKFADAYRFLGEFQLYEKRCGINIFERKSKEITLDSEG